MWKIVDKWYVKRRIMAKKNMSFPCATGKVFSQFCTLVALLAGKINASWYLLVGK
jgi:hypothetical protein